LKFDAAFSCRQPAGLVLVLPHRRQTRTTSMTTPGPGNENGRYYVLLLNDDSTPMDFVVHVLERFFNKNREEATRIMLHVHRKKVGICGVYTYEGAQAKVAQVMDYSRQHHHPLRCTAEPEQTSN
jgi:ATP-dependent Clp protease adaptor protein ClpS